MSGTKFTKGEWEVVDGTVVGEQVLFVHVVGGGVICRLSKQVDTHLPLSVEDVANAHLIAAAPKMYEMLESIVITEQMNGDDTFSELIIDLLAEARGEK